MNKWLQYADKACECLPSLVEAETDFELCVDFELNPKLKALLSVIDQLNPEDRKRSTGSSKQRVPIQETMMIVVKNQRQATDLQRLLATHY